MVVAFIASALVRVGRLRRHYSHEVEGEQRLECVSIDRSSQDASKDGEGPYKTAHGTQHVKQAVGLASYSGYVALQIDRKTREGAPRNAHDFSGYSVKWLYFGLAKLEKGSLIEELGLFQVELGLLWAVEAHSVVLEL